MNPFFSNFQTKFNADASSDFHSSHLRWRISNHHNRSGQMLMAHQMYHESTCTMNCAIRVIFENQQKYKCLFVSQADLGLIRTL